MAVEDVNANQSASPSDGANHATPVANRSATASRERPRGQRRGVWPRRSVRLRLTLLYGLLFLLSGAALLGITYGLVGGIPYVWSGSNRIAVLEPGGVAAGGGSPMVFQGSKTNGSAHVGPAAEVSGLSPAQANAQAGELRDQLISQHNSELQALLIDSGVALAVMSVASLLLGWIAAGRVLHPLRTITLTTRAISATNLNQRLALEGPNDEVKELGDTIDGLLGRLEAAFNAQRRFAANASHELRTPLTMLRTSLDVAVGKPTASPDLTVLATKLREGLDQADRLVEELLVLAHAQHRGLTNLTTVSLDGLVGAALASRRSAIDAMQLTVQTSLESVSVVGSPTLLTRMVANVVDNAVRHNVPHGFVQFTTISRRGGATIMVENGGPTFNEREVQLLGEPFQRLGTARTAADGSIGLGLSIVAAIVEAHHGSLAINAGPEGGLRVAIDLPLTGPASPPGGAA